MDETLDKIVTDYRQGRDLAPVRETVMRSSPHVVGSFGCTGKKHRKHKQAKPSNDNTVPAFVAQLGIVAGQKFHRKTEFGHIQGSLKRPDTRDRHDKLHSDVPAKCQREFEIAHTLPPKNKTTPGRCKNPKLAAACGVRSQGVWNG